MTDYIKREDALALVESTHGGGLIPPSVRGTLRDGIKALPSAPVSVPAEPTAAMIVAFNEAIDRRRAWVNQVEDGLRAALAALAAALKDGVIVPRELTEDMVMAAMSNGFEGDENHLRSDWEAMLAAAQSEIANLKGALEATNAKLREVNERGWETVADCEAEIASRK